MKRGRAEGSPSRGNSPGKQGCAGVSFQAGLGYLLSISSRFLCLRPPGRMRSACLAPFLQEPSKLSASCPPTQSLHTLGQAPAVSRSSPRPGWWYCPGSRGRWESQRVPSQPSASRFCHSPGTPFPLPGPTSSRMPTREQETAGSQGLRVGCGGQLSEFISASLISISKAFRTVERDRRKCCINVRQTN